LPLLTERIVKYIANRDAKNISSDDSHTTVPTETIEGRLAVGCGGGAFSRTGAEATSVILARDGPRATVGSTFGRTTTRR
jgi:hypothetical protein